MKILGRIKKSKVLTAVMTAVLIFQSACPTGLAYAAQKSGVSAYAAGQTIDQALGAITDEVMVSEGYDKQVTDTPAYDETVIDKLVCTTCGATKDAPQATSDAAK